MLDSLRHTFRVWVKMRWLKETTKAIDKYLKAREKMESKRYIAHVMLKEYEERYGEEDG